MMGLRLRLAAVCGLLRAVTWMHHCNMCCFYLQALMLNSVCGMHYVGNNYGMHCAGATAWSWVWFTFRTTAVCGVHYSG